MVTPLADFTPHDVDLRLKQDSHTPITFTFSDTDFTGYTSFEFKWATNKGGAVTVIGVTVTDAVNGVLDVVVGATEWAAIGTATRAVFQIEATDPSSNDTILVNGSMSFEWSL